MTATAPKEKTLDNPTPLRVFKADSNPIKEIAQESGLDEIEVKRRAIHVGLPELAKMLGIKIDKKKAA